MLDLGSRSYPIHIGKGLLDRSDLLRSAIKGRSAVIVSNETVAPFYLHRIRPHLQDLRLGEVILADGEQHKTLATVDAIYTALLEGQFDRNATLIALGGGVIGDITGFAAATYQRGIDFIQVPTTLLSQVDSSVGGKTGVNHPLGKNMIGAFHQPRAVIIDTDTLSTLPDRELSAGIAEVIKYGLLGDPDFFSWLENNMEALLDREPDALAFAIRRSCQDKADIVAADEREQGRRALLNLGHTFGHAIETGLGYGCWLHGEAVACGMLMAARLSVDLGWLEPLAVERIESLVRRAGLPTEPPAALGAARLRALMSVDKKVIDGALRLVLLRGIGQAVVTADYDSSLLDRMLERALAA